MLNVTKWALSAMVVAGLLFGWSAAGVRAADEKDVAKSTIKGKVLDKEGKGAAEVKVNLTKARAQRERRPAAGEQRQRPEPVATATTDKEGNFEMTVETKNLPDGEYRVSSGAREKGFGTTRVTVKDGKVVDKDDKPTDVTVKYGEMGARRNGAGRGQGGGNR